MKLTARDADIGRRLKEARERLNYTQEAFAKQVGIAKKRLASYEEKRVALRYDLGLRICRQFFISEKWLATGSGDWRRLMDLSSEPAVNRVELDSSYSDAWTKNLEDMYGQLGQYEYEFGFRFVPHGAENDLFIANLFDRLSLIWMQRLDDAHRGQFLTQLMDFGAYVLRHFETTGELPAVELQGASHSFEKTLRPVALVKDLQKAARPKTPRSRK